MSKKKNKSTKVKESDVSSNIQDEDMTIRVFSSVEEANEHDYRMYAALSPSASLARVTQMRLQRFPYLNTDLNPWGKEIYIDKYGYSFGNT